MHAINRGVNTEKAMVVRPHHLMIAALAIGAFALVVGAGPAFADHHVGDITLHTKDTIADTSDTFFDQLDTLDTIKIGDKYYLVTGARGGNEQGIQVVDITDPTNIHAEGRVNGTSIGRNIVDVNFHQMGTNIYALTASLTGSSIQIINITVPSAPARVSTFTFDSSCNTFDGFSPRNVDAIQIGDHHYALVTSQPCDRFVWLNITNATAPTLLFTGTDNTLNEAHAAQFTDLEDAKAFFFRQSGSKYYAYIAGSSGVQIVNLTDPANIRPAGRDAGFGNEPHMIMHHQAGSKEYTIASIASEDTTQLWISDFQGEPVHPTPFKTNEQRQRVADTPARTGAVITVANTKTNNQDFDIFEMDGRTYLALASRSTNTANLNGVTFYDITDPGRPVREMQIRDGAHDFSTFNNVRAVSAIDIDDNQYVAVGGDEGITLMHVHPYGEPIMNIVGAGGATVLGTAPNFNVVLPSGATGLSFTASVKYTPDAGNPVTFTVTKAVYTQGHRVASSVANVPAITFNNTHTSVTVPPINMTHYPVKETSIVGGVVDERTRYVAHDWANEYALILLSTASKQHVFEGRLVTSIHVTGSSQSSPSTQEEGALRLPTALSLSLGQATVGEDAGTVSITATLDAPAPPDGVSVSLYSSGGNATDGTDYTLPASIYIAAGEQSGSASITITDDAVAESDESAVISTYVDILGQAMTDSVTLTITDDDGAAVVVADQENQPPIISSAISDVTIVREDGAQTISLDGVFSDADSDSLNVTATSSDAATAAVSVSSDHTGLTLTAKARGISTITVTADDGNGGTISDTFTVVVKAAPTISSAISDISGMSIGDNRDISLDGVFSDADNDPLNVTASTSDYNIAEAIIFQDTLTIIAVSNGSATITVTAQDADGNRAADTFEVTVAAAQLQQQNRAPTISSAIADVTIPHETGIQTISLDGVFSDADNDSLNVTASSSDATKAAVSVSSDHTGLTLTAQARGISTITVTADDGNGGTISDTFTVTVKAAPTISSAISDVSGLVVGDSRTISLDGVFDDVDGDSLVITAASSNGTVATVEAASDGSALTIAAQAPGTATITVTAQDADGNQATDTFEVTVATAPQQTTADTTELEPIVAQYDTDGSGIIEQDEWEVAIQDYTDGKLTNEEIFAISQARP